jgi:hypothetical protein
MKLEEKGWGLLFRRRKESGRCVLSETGRSMDTQVSRGSCHSNAVAMLRHERNSKQSKKIKLFLLICYL